MLPVAARQIGLLRSGHFPGQMVRELPKIQQNLTPRRGFALNLSRKVCRALGGDLVSRETQRPCAPRGSSAATDIPVRPAHRMMADVQSTRNQSTDLSTDGPPSYPPDYPPACWEWTTMTQGHASPVHYSDASSLCWVHRAASTPKQECVPSAVWPDALSPRYAARPDAPAGLGGPSETRDDLPALGVRGSRTPLLRIPRKASRGGQSRYEAEHSGPVYPNSAAKRR